MTRWNRSCPRASAEPVRQIGGRASLPCRHGWHSRVPQTMPRRRRPEAMRIDMDRAGRVAGTLLLACVAALLAERMHLPLPWMIGPLLAVALAGVLGARVDSPAPLRNAGQWAIGTALRALLHTRGAGHNRHDGASLACRHRLGDVRGPAFLPPACLDQRCRKHRRTGDRVLRCGDRWRVGNGGARRAPRRTRRPHRDGAFIARAHRRRRDSLRPAGVRVARYRCHAAGARQRALRRPAAAVRSDLGRRVADAAQSLPNPFVLGSLAVAMVLTGSGIELSALPPVIGHTGQLPSAARGCALHARLPAQRAALAWVGGGRCVRVDRPVRGLRLGAGDRQAALATVLLGASPGGIAEMCITAKVLQLGVPVVTAFHVTRYLAVLLCTRPLFRWIQRRRADTGGAGRDHPGHSLAAGLPIFPGRGHARVPACIGRAACLVLEQVLAQAAPDDPERRAGRRTDRGGADRHRPRGSVRPDAGA